MIRIMKHLFLQTDDEVLKDFQEEDNPIDEERVVNTSDFGDEDENDTTPAEAEEQIEEEEKRHHIKP